MKDDSYQDDDLAKIMKELEEDDKNKKQGYNRSNFLLNSRFFQRRQDSFEHSFKQS
jgi:hypothetical protein